MKWISCALALLFLFPSADAVAGKWSAVVNGKSYHVGAKEDWNENNYGLGVEYHFDSMSRWKTSAVANAFRDSTDRLSLMAGGSLHRRLVETDRLGRFYVDAGLTAFLMTRKDVNDNRPFPGILPSIAFGNRYLGMNLTYLPAAGVRSFTGAAFEDPSIDGILFMQLKVNIATFLPGAD